jgi:DNA-binding transcriptional ArsR family regulator
LEKAITYKTFKLIGRYLEILAVMPIDTPLCLEYSRLLISQTSNEEGRGVARIQARQGKRDRRHGAVDDRLVKALSHPVRARALAILNERVASPKEIAAELNKPVGNVSYHVKALYRFGCIELVRTVPRRGATEHFYRGITRSFLNDEAWAQLSPEAKSGVSVAGLKMINDAAKAALVAETFDSRPDRHLSCTPVSLDEEGWGEVTELLAGSLERLMAIQADSLARQAEAPTHTMRATIALLSFESPSGEAHIGGA